MQLNKEFSCGAVIARKDKDKIWYLLVYSRRNRRWGFPKGHMENGEDEKSTATREIAEESGITSLKFIDGFREEDIYPAVSRRPPYKGQVIEKHSIYYLCLTRDERVTLDSREISDYRWLSFSQARSVLVYGGLNGILMKADTLLNNLKGGQDVT